MTFLSFHLSCPTPSPPQAEEFRTAVQLLLEWLSEAEQTLRFRGVLPEEAETLQVLLHTHRNFMGTVEDKRSDVNKAASMGEGILTLCHPDSITTIKHWITIIRARFEEVRGGVTQQLPLVAVGFQPNKCRASFPSLGLL